MSSWLSPVPLSLSMSCSEPNPALVIVQSNHRGVSFELGVNWGQEITLQRISLIFSTCLSLPHNLPWKARGSAVLLLQPTGVRGWCAKGAGWRLPRSHNLLLATLPSAEPRWALERLASSRQVREHTGLWAGPSQGGREGGRRVVWQLSGPAGPSAYGAVVLGCFVLKNFQRARPSGPPRCCRRGGAPSRWFANKTASAREGKETCPKWLELGPGTASGALAAAFPRDVQVCGCGQAGSAALGGVGVPANLLVAAL